MPHAPGDPTSAYFAGVVFSPCPFEPDFDAFHHPETPYVGDYISGVFMSGGSDLHAVAGWADGRQGSCVRTGSAITYAQHVFGVTGWGTL